MDHFVASLERQFAFLDQQEDPSYLQQLRACMKWLQREPKAAGMLSDITRGTYARIESLRVSNEARVARVRQLREEFERAFPDESLPVVEPSAGRRDVFEYQWSLARFDELATIEESTVDGEGFRIRGTRDSCWRASGTAGF
jgi:hypothetical protein